MSAPRGTCSGDGTSEACATSSDSRRARSPRKTSPHSGPARPPTSTSCSSRRIRPCTTAPVTRAACTTETPSKTSASGSTWDIASHDTRTHSAPRDRVDRARHDAWAWRCARSTGREDLPLRRAARRRRRASQARLGRHDHERSRCLLRYLVSNGWHAITLDEADRAGRGETTLPEKSILITVDDAYASAYTRVYPLLLATKMPAVVAMPGAWMVRGQGPEGQAVLTWPQAREMQQSGLVEFASHGHDLHGAIRGNPQASEMPAFAFRIFDPARGYEDDNAYRRRVSDDLQQSMAMMTRELVARRARSRGPTAATPGPQSRSRRHWASASVSRSTRNRPRPAVRSPFRGSRSQPARPSRRSWRGCRRATRSPHPAVRPPAPLIAVAAGFHRDGAAARGSHRTRPDPRRHHHRDRRSGAGPGRTPGGVVPYTNDTCPRRCLPAVRVAVSEASGCARVRRLPAAALDIPDAELEGMCRDFGIFTSVDGLLVEEVSALAVPGDVGSGARWEVDRARGGIDAAQLPRRERRALTCFRAVERELPGLQLAIVTGPPDPRGPAAVADLTLVRTAPDPREAGRTIEEMVRAGWLLPRSARRVGLWLESDRPPADGDLVTITRRFQREGGAALGWSPDDPVADRPRAAAVAPIVSSSNFPARF